MLVVFLQPSDSTVTYLTHPLTLQPQVLGYLGHRLMLTVQSEEAVDNLRLTLAQRQQGKLNGVLNGFTIDTLIGQR